jgi:hypothetical protein
VEGEDGLKECGDSGGAAPQFPQQAPILEGGRGLFAEGADAAWAELTARDPVGRWNQRHAAGYKRSLACGSETPLNTLAAQPGPTREW